MLGTATRQISGSPGPALSHSKKAKAEDLWKPLIPLLQTGRLRAADLFSHEMDLSEGAEAYRIFDAREESVIKIMMNVT